MNVTVQIQPTVQAPVSVLYNWDADTAILTARLAENGHLDGTSGSVELAGTDGSWVILDVQGGIVWGVEVAVWPDVREVAALHAPANATPARIAVPFEKRTGAVAEVQVDTPLLAESNPAERVIHFRFGAARAVRTVCIARDICVDVDDRHALRGIWLLNVPPCPAIQ